MPNDRITKIQVTGLRCLADVTLPIGGLKVLIGDNGTGKSSLIEALEILRRASTSTFVSDIHTIHGGVPGLLRAGSTRMRLALEADGDGGRLRYSVEFHRVGDAFGVREEYLDLGPLEGFAEPLHVIQRNVAQARVFDAAQRKLVEVQLGGERTILGSVGVLIPAASQEQRAMKRLQEILTNIQVHAPFDTTANWVSGAAGTPRSRLRESAVVKQFDRLGLFGVNLANAWMKLRNEFSEEHWRDTMEFVRLGLGSWIEAVQLKADPGGGAVGLWIKERNAAEPLPAFALSDGTLAYLAFVALYRLSGGASLIAFDEPETHLHPALLLRVLQLFDELAESIPVVLSTHNDRLLDGLSNPADAAVLLELDKRRATILRQPDAAALAKWLEHFRGIGELRASGHEREVFSKELE